MRRIEHAIVCVISDRRRLAASARTLTAELVALEAFLDEAIEAGVDVVQVREPDVPGRELLACVARIVRRASGARTVVIVNDRTDVALISGAGGVHLRADGPETARVRGIVADAWIGRSCHAGEDEQRLAGADFGIFGTVFVTPSKPDRQAAGLEGLAEAIQRAPVPVLAIGGVTPERARECRRVGAAGVAAIGLFLPEGAAPGAQGPARAVRELRAAMADAPATC